MILMENKHLKWYVPSSKIKKQGEGNGQGNDIMGRDYTSVVPSLILGCRWQKAIAFQGRGAGFWSEVQHYREAGDASKALICLAETAFGFRQFQL